MANEVITRDLDEDEEGTTPERQITSLVNRTLAPTASYTCFQNETSACNVSEEELTYLNVTKELPIR